MGKGAFSGEFSFEHCTVTVKTVKIAGSYLNRLRVWDSTGRQLVAMRIWSDKPFEPGMVMNMHPTVAPRSRITLATALDALEVVVEANEAEVAGSPALGDTPAEGGAA